MTGNLWPLAGRDGDLDVAEKHLIEGRRCLVVQGKAGIGKSRFLGELGYRLSARGWQVERIVGLGGSGMVEFGSIVHLLPDGERPIGKADLLWGALSTLEEMARTAPVVLVVDDAHALDEGSALFARHVVESSGTPVVLTVTEGAPLSPLTQSIVGSPDAQWLALAPLSRHECRLMIERSLGSRVGDDEFETTWSISGGMPLVVHELIEGAREAGTAGVSSGVWKAEKSLVSSPRVATVVEGRLACLEPDERRALEIVALSEPVDLECLSRLVERDVLERLEGAELITVVGRGKRSVALAAHRLYAEVLRAGMPTIRRRRMLSDIATALSDGPMKRADDPIRVALWRLDAGDDVDAAALVHAARQAVALFDPRLGEKLARAALPHRNGGRAHVVLAQALSSQGDRDGADDAFRTALADAATNDDIASAAIAYGFHLSWTRDDPDGALAMLHAAEERISGEERLLLTAHRANIQLALNRLEESLATADALLTEKDISPRCELLARNSAATAAALMGLSERAIDEAARGEPLVAALLGEDAGRMALFSLPCARFLATLDNGDTAGAAQIAVENREAAELLGARVLVAGWTMLGAEALLLRGRPVHAAEELRGAIAILRVADVFGHLPLALSFLVRCEAACGHVESARSALAELQTLTQSSAILTVASLATCWVAAAEGRMETAAAQARDTAEEARRASQFAIEARALHLAARFGAPGSVVHRLTTLAARLDGRIFPLFRDHALQLAQGDASGVETLVEPFACVDVAVAAELAAEAAIRFRREKNELAAIRCATRCDAVVSGAPQVGSPILTAYRARTNAPTLTARESTVAMMAAQGDSNRDIAAALHVSVRTVENHLYRIYSKLGITGRDELEVHLRGL